jgi:hypothetical protein
MNPYDATLTNFATRINAWLRGLVRRYRRPLLIGLFAVSAIFAGVITDHVNGTSDQPTVIASR